MITKEDCVLGTRVAVLISKTLGETPFLKGYVAGEYRSDNNKESVINRRDNSGISEFYLDSLVLEKDILVEEALLKAQYTQANQAWEGMKPEIIKRTKEATKLLDEIHNLMDVYGKHGYSLSYKDPLKEALEEARGALGKIIDL